MNYCTIKIVFCQVHLAENLRLRSFTMNTILIRPQSGHHNCILSIVHCQLTTERKPLTGLRSPNLNTILIRREAAETCQVP